MEDEILIKYLRKNDRKAYSILFDKYFERLFTFAVRVVFREDVANDIVQEIFISLYEKSEILNYDLSLKSYLFNSVRNRCFNYLRDRKVEDAFWTKHGKSPSVRFFLQYNGTAVPCQCTRYKNAFLLA